MLDDPVEMGDREVGGYGVYDQYDASDGSLSLPNWG
jgi:hypothetical protein